MPLIELYVGEDLEREVPRCPGPAPNACFFTCYPVMVKPPPSEKGTTSTFLKGFWYFLYYTKDKRRPQIYTKLTGFNDNGGRELPFKYYLLRSCSFEKAIW